MLRYVMLCYVMLCYVMLCYVMLCYVMLCYVMLRYVTLCYVMLGYVMLCNVMLGYVRSHIWVVHFSMHLYLYFKFLCKEPGNAPTNDWNIYLKFNKNRSCNKADNCAFVTRFAWWLYMCYVVT